MYPNELAKRRVQTAKLNNLNLNYIALLSVTNYVIVTRYDKDINGNVCDKLFLNINA